MKEKQFIFIQNVAKLITWAFEKGYQLTIGEALRTQDQQLLYFEGLTPVKTGGHVILAKTNRKTQTLASKHLDKLAIDLNLFINGVYRTDKESYKELAEYWKSLHHENVSGYDWGWDANHFQMGK